MKHKDYDVAIIGGGPAGLQAALVLARTRKNTIVFEAPSAPRNGASHGVHNFIGLDGLRPAEIRELVWQQINVYASTEQCNQAVVDIQQDEGAFIVTGENGTVIRAKKVILAMGFRDIYPDVPGFIECWGDTIFTCPFCDGYENRDRVWGLVINSELALEHLPHMYQNWTSEAKIILHPDIPATEEQKTSFANRNIPVHTGEISSVHHTGGKVSSIELNTGETVEVTALMWRPDEAALELTKKVIKNFDLDLTEAAYIQTDASYQTSTPGLYAVGDILGWEGAIGAANAGAMAAFTIVHHWYAPAKSQ